jgi:hypothetical protein
VKNILLYYTLLFIIGCKKNSPVNCYDNVLIQASTTLSNPCTGTGTLIITNPVGSQYDYKINNLPFQKSNTFNLLKPGTYTITTLESNGCISDTTVFVDTIDSGIKFKAVATTLATYCIPCHAGNNPQAGLDFLNVCDIMQHWERIKVRAVDNNPTSMPPLGPIPMSEKNKIMDWINSGHRYED